MITAQFVLYLSWYSQIRL